jgi:hypothetical protein
LQNCIQYTILADEEESYAIFVCHLVLCNEQKVLALYPTPKLQDQVSVTAYSV